MLLNLRLRTGQIPFLLAMVPRLRRLHLHHTRVAKNHLCQQIRHNPMLRRNPHNCGKKHLQDKFRLHVWKNLRFRPLQRKRGCLHRCLGRTQPYSDLLPFWAVFERLGLLSMPQQLQQLFQHDFLPFLQCEFRPILRRLQNQLP